MGLGFQVGFQVGWHRLRWQSKFVLSAMAPNSSRLVGWVVHLQLNSSVELFSWTLQLNSSVELKPRILSDQAEKNIRPISQSCSTSSWLSWRWMRLWLTVPALGSAAQNYQCKQILAPIPVYLLQQRALPCYEANSSEVLSPPIPCRFYSIRLAQTSRGI